MPHINIFVMTTAMGGIPDVEVYADEESFLKAARTYFRDHELWVEYDEEDDHTDAVDDEGRVIAALIETYHDVPTFASDGSKYDFRWYRNRIEIDPATLRSFVHDIKDEYDPGEHGYVCPGGHAACPCGAVKVPPSASSPTHDIPTRDEFALLVTNALLDQTDATDVTVDVSDWAGYGDVYRGAEDTWVDPIYVTAEDDDEEEEFHDAVIDLGDPHVSTKTKVERVVDDLING